MKKFLSFTLSMLMLFSLASCGDDGTSSADTSETVTENNAPSALTTNRQGFFHFSHSFSENMKTDTDRSTPVCLCATYKGAESDGAQFIVSASLYDDGGNSSKAQSLSYAVKQREESSSDVFEKTFGGITFYGVCFDSYEYDGKRLLNMFGQTEAFDDGTYYFLEITVDNMESDDFLSVAEKELSTLKFF